MGGLEELIKQIGGLDSGWKIAGFAICAVLILFVLLGKRAGIKIDAFATKILYLIAFLAVLPMALYLILRILDHEPKTYTIAVTLTNADGKPYNSGEAEVIILNARYISNVSLQTNSFEFEYDTIHLARDRKITIYGHTKNDKFSIDTSVQLTDAAFQPFTFSLRAVVHVVPPDTGTGQGHKLHPDSPNPRTFFIDLPDKSIQEDIERNSEYKFDPFSIRNKITVTYDSSNIVYRASSHDYVFRSSSPIVEIDGARFRLEGCSIEESSSHNKGDIQKYGRDQSIVVATEFLKRNPKLIASWLKKH